MRKKYKKIGRKNRRKKRIFAFLLLIVLVVEGQWLQKNLTKDKGVSYPSYRLEELASGEWSTEGIEDTLVSVLAGQIRADAPKEALRAQAIIARTNLIGDRLVGSKEDTGLTINQMVQLYGEDKFKKYYHFLEDAVEDTRGMLLVCDEKVIEASYFAVSAGRTRNAVDVYGGEGLSYLQSVESSGDFLSEDYLSVEFYDPSEFWSMCRAAYPDAGLPEIESMLSGSMVEGEGEIGSNTEIPIEDGSSNTEGENMTVTDTEGAEEDSKSIGSGEEPDVIQGQIQILSRDEAEYVNELQLGQQTISGEEFRQALSLPSACFQIKQVDNQIRVVTKGLGHGVGLCQYGAIRMAQEGANAEEILKYYYSGVEIRTYTLQ